MILHQIITPNTTGGSNRAGSTWKNSKSFRGVQIHLGSKLTELELDIGFIPFQLEHLSGTIDPGSSCRPVGKGNHPRYRSFIELLKITALWFSNKTTSPSEIESPTWRKNGQIETINVDQEECNTVEESWKFLQMQRKFTSHHNTFVTSHTEGTKQQPHSQLNLWWRLQLVHIHTCCDVLYPPTILIRSLIEQLDSIRKLPRGMGKKGEQMEKWIDKLRENEGKRTDRKRSKENKYECGRRVMPRGDEKW